jgi:hypothetical protein
MSRIVIDGFQVEEAIEMYQTIAKQDVLSKLPVSRIKGIGDYDRLQLSKF